MPCSAQPSSGSVMGELLLQPLAFFTPCSLKTSRPKAPLFSPFPHEIMYHCFCYLCQLKEMEESISVPSWVYTIFFSGEGVCFTLSALLHAFLGHFCHLSWWQLGNVFSYWRTFSDSRMGRAWHPSHESERAPASLNSFPTTDPAWQC